jgi:hypothetical protein
MHGSYIQNFKPYLDVCIERKEPILVCFTDIIVIMQIHDCSLKNFNLVSVSLVMRSSFWVAGV